MKIEHLEQLIKIVESGSMNIAAKDLDKTYTVTVSTAEGKVVTVKTCALSYAYKVVNKGTDEALVNLVKGLYLYNQAANAYFG